MTPSDTARLVPVHLRRELLAHGWHDRAIAHQLHTGAWVRPRRGAYVDATAWRDLSPAGQHMVVGRAVLKQAQTDAAISHSSAVPWHGGPTWGIDFSAVHTTRLDGLTGRDEAGVVQHSGLLLPDDVTLDHDTRVTHPARTAIEVSTTHPLEVAVCVLNDFLHRKLTTAQAVRERYEAGMTQWPGSRATDMAIRLADPRIESVLESRFMVLCFNAGLPRPVPQWEVKDAAGRVLFRLDFAWPELGAYVETDGRDKYDVLLRPGERPSDVIFRQARREELVRGMTGWRGMRVVWDDVEHADATGLRVRRHLFPVAQAAS